MTGIQINEQGELTAHVVKNAAGQIVSGMSLGDIDYQCTHLVVTANKGEFKENPVLGLGAERFLKSVNRANELRREIGVQLSLIGYSNADITVSKTGQIEINI
jgi:hypothetical protein